MQTSTLREMSRHSDLLSSFKSLTSRSLSCRNFSVSTSNKSHLPFFHKKLKKYQPGNSSNAPIIDNSNAATLTPSPRKVSPTSSNTTFSHSSPSPSSSTQKEISKRHAFKSITPSPQIMNDIRIQGLGAKSEYWSFDKSSRGNKTIRPWDKKLSPEEFKKQEKAKRLPSKQVWFEERTTKVVEKEEVKFPGMRFIAGASSIKSVPSERELVRLTRPHLFEELEDIEKLIQEGERTPSGNPASEGDESSATVHLTINSEGMETLQTKRREKEAQIKDSILQEIAVVGRSNVGKSTMLNTLTASHNTARVSSKPGLTRQLNFYRCGDKFALVDMPGYGFAFAKEEDKSTWKELIEEYIVSRKSLRRIYVMIDARHGLKVADKEFLSMLDRTTRKFQIVLTKCDLVSPPDLARRYMVVQEELKKTYRNVIAEKLLMVSSYTGAGMNNLRKDILFVCGQNILVRERERPQRTLK